MPELPEVEALVAFVAGRTTGRRIERAELASLSALKTYDPPVSALTGRVVEGCERRGKHLCLRAEGPLWLVVHLSRAGWLQWRDQLTPARAKPGRGPLALRVGLDDGAGFDLTEQGTEKRLALWVVSDPSAVASVARLGPDPLDPAFDVQALRAGLARPGNLKTVLVDQSVIAGVGNAYSDEALHAARLSPYKPAAKLTDDQLVTLHDAIVGVLRDALARSEGMAAKGLKGEKRSGMAVHGRTGEPCPVCGDTVREVRFSNRSLQYCPTCQTGGTPLADRRLSRLLK